MTIHPIVGMLLVGAGFAVQTAGLHALRKAREPGPELLRKLLHIGMGIISVALPRLFDASWPVLFLASLFVLGLAGGRFVPCWRHLRRWGHLQCPSYLRRRHLFPHRRC